MDNWLNWIGLAKRAGKLAPGHNQVQIALTNNKAHLVIIALHCLVKTFQRGADICAAPGYLAFAVHHHSS